MDRKFAALMGAVSALALLTSMEAARAREAKEVLSARSYADLFQPIPDALDLLTVADAAAGSRGNTGTAQEGNVQLAQYWGDGYYYHHHHHHHHHHYRRRYYHHHHHHHHHHHGYYYPYPYPYNYPY